MLRQLLHRAGAVGWKPMLTSAVLALALVAVALAQTHAGRRVTGDLGLSAAREPFTELYFDDPSAVVAHTEAAHPGVSSEPLAFVIRNQEGRSLEYRWSVSIGGTTAYTGSQALGPGQKDTVRQRIRVPCPPAAARKHVSGPPGIPRQRTGPAGIQVRVSLQQPRESIDYWVACHG